MDLLSALAWKAGRRDPAPLQDDITSKHPSEAINTQLLFPSTGSLGLWRAG